MYQSTTINTQTAELDQDYGYSKNVSFVSVVRSSFFMNLKLLVRYKASIIGGFLEFMVISFVFSIFAYSMYYKGGYEWMTQTDIVIFYMGAILIMTFNSVAMWNPLAIVQRDIYNGTIEYLYFNPSSKYGYFVGNILADAFVKLIALFLPALIIISYFAGILSHPTVVAEVFAVSLLVLVNLISVGILISLTAILWKQVSAIVGILNMLFQFLSGAFFPITAYPQPVQWLAYLLPTTWGYDLVRYYSFRGAWTPIFPIAIEIGIMLFFTLFYIVISYYLLKKTERFAKRKGLHII